MKSVDLKKYFKKPVLQMVCVSGEKCDGEVGWVVSGRRSRSADMLGRALGGVRRGFESRLRGFVTSGK